jgi:hypothetical protein
VTTWETEVAADSPLFVWTPDNFTSETLSDESGNGRSIVTHSFVEVPYGAWMDVAACTVEAWINTTQTGLNMIAAREGASPRVFQFRLNSAAVDFVKIAGGTVTVSNSSVALNNGTDRHVVATYDGATIKVYADAGTPASAAGTGVLSGGTKSLTLGVRYNTSINALADMFFGQVKGFAYYGSALSAARVAAHFAAGPPSGVAPGTLNGVWGIVG